MKFMARFIGARLVVVAFWIAIIFVFLFSPLVSRFFYQQKSLNLFIWPMILDPKVLTKFEQETGIKVYLNYYESNEELYSKLKATKGEGYDIIVPTDYTVELLIKDGLLKKIEKDKLTFFNRIKPFLLGNYYDRDNAYSVPYYMSVFGLGINRDYFKEKQFGPITWGLVFNEKKIVSSISMLDSPRESIMLAGYYLFGSIDSIANQNHLKEIAALLIKQKQWVDVYTSARIEELLASGSCPIAVGTSPDVWKASREYANIDFVLPEEGSFVTIDSFVIPLTTQKDDLIYQLLNFLYQPDIIEHNSCGYGFCSPTADTSVNSYGVFCPTAEQFNKLDFFRNVLTKKQMQDLWISVKAR